MTESHVNVGCACPACLAPEGSKCRCAPTDELAGLKAQMCELLTLAESGVAMTATETGLLSMSALLILSDRLEALERRVRVLEREPRLPRPAGLVPAPWHGWDADVIASGLEQWCCCNCGDIGEAPRPRACPRCGSQKLV